jgi:hypothetical protein
LLVDFWGNDMSGMEPILIGAALGAGVGGATSAIGGGDPLKGALMGGLTGAAGGGLTGGLGSVGATAQAGASTAAQTGALNLPSTVGASLVESGASGVMGDVLEQAALSGASYSSNPFMAGAQHLMSNPSTTLSAITGGMPGGEMAQQLAMQNIGGLAGGGQQPQQIQARPISPGQYQPAQSLLEERQMMPPRRRISLL